MEYYFAPMEGITGYIFRNAHHACFGGMDRYYTPFLTPKQGKSFTSREWNDVLPQHNEGICVIPQILTNQAEGFLKMAGYLKEFGYTEVNLNLGCPSGTVVAKKKGAGFLAFPQELDAFLEQIFEGADIKISVKTRIGKEDPEEFGPLLEIFNQYPLEKLIVHPRVQTDFYKNEPNLEVFSQTLKNSKNPVCYNGDLFSAEKIKAFTRQYPDVDSVMLGRGLLVNPALLTGSVPDAARLRAFLDKLLTDYSEILSGERDVLFKMKELWFYLGKLFPDGEKHLKKIRKSQKLSEYQSIVNTLLNNCPMQLPDHISF
ncbi:MAG: tRNA-dihydrouridine synthase family protein [Eubacteriales bacterium]|nr:tRNA-dihydrouridine synthase family protein [Eubacteriales bacterium]